MKAIRKVASKIIAFLAQLENFQKKLWLKKKFVIETNYCITLDRVPEDLYSEIVKNKAQHDEWENLFSISKILDGKKISPDFLKRNDKLVLDTKFFSAGFKEKLIDLIEGFDEKVNGLLVNSENFQALNMLSSSYSKLIDCVYIDPPYNTGSDDFIYKDSYQHSSWMSFIKNRAEYCVKLLSDDAVLFSSIDDNEEGNLSQILSSVFTPASFESKIIVRSNKRGQTYQSIAKTHEYILTYCVGKDSEIFELPKELSEDSPKDSKGMYELWELRNRNPKFTRANRPNLYYPFYVNTNDVDSDGFAPISTEKDKTFSYEVYPKNSKGDDSCWRWQSSTANEAIKEGDRLNILAKQKKDGGWNIYEKSRKSSKKAKTIWDEIDMTTEQGTIQLKKLGFSDFSFPKPPTLIEKVIKIGSKEKSMVLDFFAGSGTTGHAVINLHRDFIKSGINLKETSNVFLRKYLLIEMGKHFDTVLRPRIQKVIYSADWSDGQPTSRDTGISQCVKYIRLESFDDTLNNLEVKNNVGFFDLLEKDSSLKEDYLLNYMLEFETKDSPSLLSVKSFSDPLNYKLKIKKAGSEENELKTIDMIETFNYLIGLNVEKSYLTNFISAKTKKDSEGRLVLDGELKIESDSAHWVKPITGKLNNGDNLLILWRNLTDNRDTDNLLLNEWLKTWLSENKKELNSFSKIYVNGDSTISNIPLAKNENEENGKFQVRLIEEDFSKLMFEEE